MHLRLLVVLLLLGSTQVASAHRHYKRGAPGKPFIRTRNAVVGQLGLGAAGGYFAAGAALEYEHIFTKTQWLALTVKVGGYRGGTMNLLGGPIQEGEVFAYTRAYFVAPGIRFHPDNNRLPTDFCVGLAFPLGHGTRADNAHDTYYNGSVGVTKSHFFGAILGELIINFRSPGNHGIFGFFINPGYIYSNVPAVTYTFSRASPNSSENAPLYLQFGLRFGGRW